MGAAAGGLAGSGSALTAGLSLCQCPLGGAFAGTSPRCCKDSSLSSSLSVPSSFLLCRGDKFNRLRTSLLEVIVPGAPRNIFIGPVGCWGALCQNIFRLCTACTFSSMAAIFSLSMSGASAGLEQAEPAEE